MKRLATIGAVGLLTLGGVAAQAQTPPPRTAVPAAHYRICGHSYTRSELRIALHRRTLCLRVVIKR